MFGNDGNAYVQHTLFRLQSYTAEKLLYPPALYTQLCARSNTLKIRIVRQTVELELKRFVSGNNRSLYTPRNEEASLPAGEHDRVLRGRLWRSHS